MPPETSQAIEWALGQTFEGRPVTTADHHAIVHLVREWFNEHEVAYGTFSFDDLEPYLPK